MHPALALVSYLGLLLALPVLWLHPKLKEGFWQRLGGRAPDWKAMPPGPRILMHGASAGDIVALLPTARVLKEKLGAGHIVASTITNSGFAMANRRREIFSQVIYGPVDVPHAVARVLDRVRPQVLVLEYTELWPNLIRAAKKRKIPIILHNGRLSALKRRSYRLLFMLSGNLLRAMSALLMRDDKEAEQALLLGAKPERVFITGNTKFDNLAERVAPSALDALARATGFAHGVPLFVAGSTHEGEEEHLLEIFVQLREELGPLNFLLAPRYPERAERIVALASKHQLRVRRRSQCGEGAAEEQRGSSEGSSDVFLLDTLGELHAAYSLATLVFVGGSFVPRGGQNILEPAACGRPVLFGPYMHNFVDSLQVLLGRGGLQVQTWPQLKRLLGELLQRPEDCKKLGAMAEQQVRAVRGAAERNAAHILEQL